MGRVVFAALLAVFLAGCGPGYEANGACQADADCQLCTVCGCARAYALRDTGQASCGEIASGERCTQGKTYDCLSGPLQPLCVSGKCAAISRLAP